MQSDIGTMDISISSPLVLEDQDSYLTRMISFEEIEEAIWSVHPNKAPGLGGFSNFSF